MMVVFISRSIVVIAGRVAIIVSCIFITQTRSIVFVVIVRRFVGVSIAGFWNSLVLFCLGRALPTLHHFSFLLSLFFAAQQSVGGVDILSAFEQSSQARAKYFLIFRRGTEHDGLESFVSVGTDRIRRCSVQKRLYFIQVDVVSRSGAKINAVFELHDFCVCFLIALLLLGIAARLHSYTDGVQHLSDICWLGIQLSTINFCTQRTIARLYSAGKRTGSLVI
jgi:hypothetical protein